MQISNHLAVSLGNILYQKIRIGIVFQRILCIFTSEKFGKQLCRSRDCLSCSNPFFLELLHKLEVFYEWMVLTRDASRQLNRAWCGLFSVELVSMFKFNLLYTIESPHEIQVPIASAELSVSNHFQPVCLLFGNEVGDETVLNSLQLGMVNLSFFEFLSCFFQFFWT